MKALIVAILMLGGLVCMHLAYWIPEAKARHQKEREDFVKDSLNTVKLVNDSIASSDSSWYYYHGRHN